MSIDLRRPLVPSMGQHDPLDGLLTCMELRAGLAAPGREATALDLMIDDYRSIGAASDWTTDDPLGIGGLLAGATGLAHLIARDLADDVVLLEQLLHCAAAGLGSFRRRSPLGLPAQHRLAFRELGLAIGLHGVQEIAALWQRDAARLGGAAVELRLRELRASAPLAAGIEDCWLDPTNRAVAAWTSHRDIDEVMLATSLLSPGRLTA
jgi:hypothetical protein